MKKLVIISVLLFSLSFISALYAPGNPSFVLNDRYATNSILTGSVNLSVTNEPTDTELEFRFFNRTSTGITELTSLKQKMNLSEVINKTGIAKICVPSGCEPVWGLKSSSSSKTKTIKLNAGQQVTYGVSINGESIEMSGFYFNVQSDAPESNKPQLEINLLDDSELEWFAYQSSGTINPEEFKGCYKQATDTGIIAKIESGENVYCNYIVPEQSSHLIEINAKIIRYTSGPAGFILTAQDLETGEIGNCSKDGFQDSMEIVECVPINPSTGKNFSVTKGKAIQVCIAPKAGSEERYKINRYQNESCGQEGNLKNHFEISIQLGNYAQLGSFTFNESSIQSALGISEFKLNDYLDYYLGNTYDGDCNDQNGCVIPIKFTANVAQNITLSSLNAKFKDDGVLDNTDLFYETEKEEAHVGWAMQKLDLTPLKIKTPEKSGNYAVRIYFTNTTDDYMLADKNFSTEKFPEIVKLNDQTSSVSVVAGRSEQFNATINYTGTTGVVSSYFWDFGNNENRTTTSNIVNYTYNQLGTYTLTLTITSGSMTSSKTFQINADNPKDAVASGLASLRQSVTSVNSSLQTMPAFHQASIKKQINFDRVLLLLKAAEDKNKVASTEADYISLMKNLSEIQSLNFPRIVARIYNGPELPFKVGLESTDLDMIVSLTGEDYDTSKTDAYIEEIHKWGFENIDAKVIYDTYLIQGSDSSNKTLSFVKITVSADSDNAGSYLFFPGFDMVDSNLGAIQTGTGFVYVALDGNEKILEFSTNKVVSSPDTITFFASPALEEITLPTAEQPVKESLFVRYKWVIFGILAFILLIIFIIVYRAAGNWYNKKYENHLFPNKNQLYNIINYVHASKERGVKDKEISESLLKAKWGSEQVRYIMRKYAGKNPGMLGMKDPRIRKPEKTKKGYKI